jgi:hypothetical protein
MLLRPEDIRKLNETLNVSGQDNALIFRDNKFVRTTIKSLSETIRTLSLPIILTSEVDGVLPIANGGTGDSTGSPTFTGLTLSGLTASTITATDASKNLQSLSTTTYPSLTELSYVKGTTSSLQNQLNGKLSLDQTTPETISNGIPLLDVDLADFNTDKQLVNKEYVDSAINFVSDYYFNNTASDIGGIYYQMTDQDLGEPGIALTKSDLGAGDDQALFNFATNAGVPGTDKLNKGVYKAHVHAAKANGTRSVVIYVAIYIRDTVGTETLVGTSVISPELTSTITDYDLYASVPNEVALASTDRIICKFFANIGASGSAVDVILYIEDNYNSALTVPIESNVLSQIYVRQDGTKPLTANWDAGSFNITAQNFIGSSARFTGLPGSDGDYLTTDGSGNLTLGALASSAVTSITGTAGQVLANGVSGASQVGAVTLTLPQDIFFNKVTTGNNSGYFIKKSSGSDAQVLFIDNSSPDNLYIGSADINGDTYFQNANGSINHGALLANGNWAFGAVSSSGGKVNCLATTEQLRLSYDASNYASATVDASANLSINTSATNPVISVGDTGGNTTFNIQASSTTGFSAIGFFDGAAAGSISYSHQFNVLDVSVGGGFVWRWYPSGGSRAMTVNNNVYLSSFNNGSTAFIDLIKADTSNNIVIGSDYVSIDTNGEATFTTSTNVNSFYMRENGTNPYFEVSDGTLQGILGATPGATGITVGSLSNHDVRFVANDTEYMRLDTSGNYGLNTAPLARTYGSVGTHNYSMASTTGNRCTQVLDSTDQRLTLGAYWEAGVAQYSYIQSSNDAETSFGSLLLNPAGGNVGIGIEPSAGKALHIYRNLIGETNFLIEGAAANAFSVTQLQLKNDTSNLFAITMYSSIYTTVGDRNAVNIVNSAGELRLGGSGGNAIKIETNNNVAVSGLLVVGGSSASGQITANQTSTTAAIPPLYLNQADISEEMIEFNTTIGTGNAIEAVGSKTLTVTHFIKVNIGTVGFRYLPVGTIA